MTDIEIYFQSCNVPENLSKESLGARIVTNTDEFPDIRKGDLVIFQFTESRTFDNDSSEQGDLWRQEFYKLYAPENWSQRVIDLGTIVQGAERKDSYYALEQTLEFLIKKQAIPLIVGGSQDLTLVQYLAYEKLEQLVNLLVVDPALDLCLEEEELTQTNYLTKILLHQPNYLFNCSVIGYQTYLCNPEFLKTYKSLYFDAVRYGEFIDHIQLMEPLFRNSDMVSIDLDAIRSGEYPGNTRSLPNGFTSRELCQVMRYAGLSDKLNSLSLCNYSESENPVNANMVAQMLWSFIDGYNERVGDFPVGSKVDYKKYHVQIEQVDDRVTFYKSPKSGRWWIQVPHPKKEGALYGRHELVPCDYRDYECAMNNDLPEIWWRTLEKLK